MRVLLPCRLACLVVPSASCAASTWTRSVCVRYAVHMTCVVAVESCAVVLIGVVGAAQIYEQLQKEFGCTLEKPQKKAIKSLVLDVVAEENDS